MVASSILIAVATSLLNAAPASPVSANRVVFPASEPRGDVDRGAADALFKRSQSTKFRKKRRVQLTAASDAFPNNPSLAAAAALAQYEGKRWCESLRLSLRAWLLKEGIPKSLRNYVLTVKVLPGAARRCGKAHGAPEGFGFAIVDVSPAGASVAVDGVSLGKARIFAARPGARDIVVSAVGHRSNRTSLEIEPLRHTSARVVLDEKEAPMSATNGGRQAGAALATLAPMAPTVLPNGGVGPADASAQSGDGVTLGLVIGGAVVAIAGGVLVGLAHSEADGILEGIPSGAGVDTPADQAAFNSTWKPVFDERAERVQLFETVGWVSVGLGAGLLLAGAINAALGGGDDSETASGVSLFPTVSNDAASLSVGGRF